uniref:Oligodendrocyte-myelin glycoprotein-like n=1 Tax=Acanthochromis polyacanthus TaxID=80966 RepID=A0A3Q1ENQ9_9TELE
MRWCRWVLLLVLCICPLACLTTSPCPPGCCCPRPGFLVLCESLGLRSLPRSVPLSTSVLSVARNQLCNVDHLLRPFSGLLESLLLQENRITYITSGVLRQLGNLTRLDLEDNRIRAIQPGALQGLNKLQVLRLKGNKLTSLPVNLPPSLSHLDLSENCISALDLPSLSALVNLQVLKINSNCLRSVPESAFDGLPRLRSVDLTDNLWACECDILYLYRWLLSGRLKMATDLVCTEPVHLAHRLLLNLSVMTICPHVLKPNDLFSALERKLAVKPTAQSSYGDSGDLLQKTSRQTTVGFPSEVHLFHSKQTIFCIAFLYLAVDLSVAHAQFIMRDFIQSSQIKPKSQKQYTKIKSPHLNPVIPVSFKMSFMSCVYNGSKLRKM